MAIHACLDPRNGAEEANNGLEQGQDRSSFAQNHAEAHGMDSEHPSAVAGVTLAVARRLCLSKFAHVFSIGFHVLVVRYLLVSFPAHVV